MSEPTKTELQEVGDAVAALRATVESKSVDHAAVSKINTFLDSHEEKFNQPLVQAAELAKTQALEIKELQETLETSGITAAEAKGRMDALETQLAHANPGAPVAFRDSDEYKALNEYCVKGLQDLSSEQKALLRTDIQSDGGYLVPTEMDSQLTKKITEIDAMRSVSRVRTISSKSLEMAIRSTIPTAEYEGENEQGTEGASTYENVTVTPYRQTFTTPITWDMLMDASFDMTSELTSDAAEAFGFGEGNGFVVGTGHKQPEGFTVNANLRANARTTAASGVLDPEALILLTGDLKVGYDPVYVMSRATLAQIRTFRAGSGFAANDGKGEFLWQPGLNGGADATINGFRYVLMNSMPAIANSAFSVGFGDFRRGYTIVDRTGFSLIRDDVTQKRKAAVEFTFNRWNTGRVTLEEPIKLLQIAA